jgi:hypothetical protein
MSVDSNIRRLIGQLLQSINEQLDSGHWFVIRDDDGVHPNALTLRELTELDSNKYVRVLVLSGLCRLGAKGVEIMKKEWDVLLREFAEDGSYIHAFIPKKTFVLGCKLRRDSGALDGGPRSKAVLGFALSILLFHRRIC